MNHLYVTLYYSRFQVIPTTLFLQPYSSMVFGSRFTYEATGQSCHGCCMVFQLVVFWSVTLPIVDLWQCCARYFRLRVTQSLPLPNVLARVTRGALVAHIYTLVCASQLQLLQLYRRTFVLLSVSLWYDLGCPLFNGVGMLWPNSFPVGQCFPVGLICSFLLSPTNFSFSSFHGLVVWGWGLRIVSVLTLY